MKRRLLNLLTMLSLFLCVAACALWAWSYDTWRVGSARGQVLVLVTGGDGADGEEYVQKHEGRDASLLWENLRTQATQSVAIARFEYHRGVTAGPFSTFPFTLLAVPLWPLVVLTLAFPAARFWVARRARHRSWSGRCSECGYDLRGTRGGRCPECGHEAPRPSAHLPAEATQTGG